MDFAPLDWPDGWAPPDHDCEQCRICYGFHFEPETASHARWKKFKDIRRYFWEWHAYSSKQCQFCDVILTLFWMCAEDLGYTPRQLHKDFKDLLICVSFKSEQVSMEIVPYESGSRGATKEAGKIWRNKGWNLSIPDKGLLLQYRLWKSMLCTLMV